MSAADAYRPDLAHIHDAGYGALARSAADLLRQDLRQRNVSGGLIVDLGCGSGILSEAMADAGFDVLGIDISEAMISLARRRVPRGRFCVESLLKAEIPPCVAVAAVGECVNYLFDRSLSLTTLGQLFRRVHAALPSGGPFLLDVVVPGRVPGGSSRSFNEGDGWAVLVAAEEDRQCGLLTRQITTFRRVGTTYRRDHEVHQQRLLSRTQVAERLREVGFRVRHLRGYGSLRFGRGHAGFLARKV